MTSHRSFTGRRRSAAAIAAAFLLLASACGGGDDDASQVTEPARSDRDETPVEPVVDDDDDATTEVPAPEFALDETPSVPDGFQQVAARCEASIDRRIMPEESASEIATAILDRVSEAGIDSDGIRVELEIEMEMPGFRTPPEHPLPNAAVAALTDASGLRPSVGGWSAACDGGYIARDLGVPCIVFGPGGLNDQAHQANESVGIDELIAAARAYALLALRLIGEETA